MRNDFQPGATLGRYEIVRKLAVGGMAQIYLARVRATAGFEKLVVLKRISPLVAGDREFVQMFLDEARLAATLRHPNIADVFDIGEDAGSYYFAMEFIHGQDARSVRQAAKELAQPIPLEVALGIISGTAYALAYAHAKEGPSGPLGLVHRDVSPSNILVSYDGAVKLVDFGIARVGNRISQKTRTGTLKGKVPYMSPEQCHGHAIDRRADIFSLGTVFYELTCGVRPFDGHSEYDTLEMIAHGRLERPSAKVASYPPVLEAIVLRMLAHEPAKRYQTADDVLADLERFTSDRGLLVSERVVAKYMRELFADELAASERPGRAPSLGEDPPTQPEEMEPLLEMPELQVFVKRAGSSPPEAARPAPTRPAHWPRVPMPDRSRPPAQQRAATFQDEPPTLQPADFDDENPTEQTSRATAARSLAHITLKHSVLDTLRDGDLTFDPVLARTHEILDDIDGEAPTNETPEDRAVRRIDELAARATAWLAIGELESAAIAADLAFGEETSGPRAERALDAELPTFEAALEGYLGDLERTAILACALDELPATELDPRMRHLLTRIARAHEGARVSGLLEDPVMDRTSVARWLCRLALRKMILLA